MMGKRILWEKISITLITVKPLPFGATPSAHGYNFSVYSKNATECSLVLFEPSITDAVQEIELLPEWNKTGNVWHVEVIGVGDDIRYGWRMGGDNEARGR